MTAVAESVRTGPPSSPVAVVWCRQVDNEAESPGYTTVPEEFPGARETLETIRIVGNLTINIADTQDYWDPDPSQPLSYYPNVFLYPANGGRYTCVGRMFLSTEDRPRLGMKTVVLDTAQLLASGEFGATVVRWHASMGGARPGGRLPPVPDPGLYAVVGEGFLFQRGTTDPVVLVASDEWEPATQAMIDLLRQMPASLIAPAAFLAFPYFLPAAKTDLKELTERFPLALALMRVARGEAGGDRHAKRIGAWEAECTVRDLTDGVPIPSRGKETVPLVLQYARDREESKLRAVAQRVDLVETPRMRSRMADPDRASGKDRRKEMWRVATAMESAALLLSKPRGRHVPISGEVAKRAQEYLDARVPVVPEAPAPSSSGASPEPLAAGHHPPWLQRNDALPSVRVDRVEVVPVSHSDDPSLLPAPMPRPAPVEATPTIEVSDGAPGPGPAGSFRPGGAPPADLLALKAELERNVARWVELRLSQIAPATPTLRPEEVDERVQRAISERLHAAPVPATPSDLAELEARLSASVAARFAALPAPVTSSDLSDLEARVTSAIAARLAALPPSLAPGELPKAEGRLQAIIDARFEELRRAVAGAASQSALAAATAPLLQRIAALEAARDGTVGTAALDARLRELEDQNAAEIRAASESVMARLPELVARATDRMRTDSAATAEDLRQAVKAQLEVARVESVDRARADLAQIEARVDALVARRLAEADAGRPKTSPEEAARVLEEQIIAHLTAPGSGLAPYLDGRIGAVESKISARQQDWAGEIREAQAAAAAELQVRLQAYFDQRLRESADRQRDTSVELLARMKGEVEQGLAHVGETLAVQEAIRGQFAKLTEAERGDRDRATEAQIQRSESRVRTDFLSAVHRLESMEKTLEDRSQELREIEGSLRTDLAEVDRRTVILSDRLVPVIRKTWTRLDDLEKSAQGSDGAGVAQLRRELLRELHRLETELGNRETALRERMETAIANQGRVWLTLIRQLSDLRGANVRAPAPAPVEEAPEAPAPTEEASAEDGLEDLPDLLRSRRGGGRPAPEPTADDASARRRRGRAPSRGTDL